MTSTNISLTFVFDILCICCELGTLQEIEKHPEIQDQIKKFLWNDVKICPNCHKPNAYTMDNCNACTTDISKVEIGKSENVFMAFLLGVEKGERFPLAISVRAETEDALVFDDLLALSPCHLNVIPKQFYIPDWRFLLNDPERGLQLLDTLTATVRDVMEKQFYSNKEWVKCYYQDSNISFDEFMEGVGFGFNFPPSQFQLHIQCVAMPLFPLHHYLLEKLQHFHQNRFFPVAYAKKCLEMCPKNYKVHKMTKVEKIVSDFDALGVSYDSYWRDMVGTMTKYSYDRSRWNAKDFDYLVVGNDAHGVHKPVIDSYGQVSVGEMVNYVNLSDVHKHDKEKLQSYGGGTDGDKPSLEYIGNPRKPVIGEEGLIAWPDAAPGMFFNN